MIPSILEAAVLTHGDEEALAHDGRSLSYREVADRISRQATGVQKLSAAVGDRVALLAANGPLFFQYSFAVARAGRVLVPLNLRLPAGGLARLVEHAEASVLLCTAQTEEQARAVVEKSSHPVSLHVLDEARWAEPLPDLAPSQWVQRRPEDPAQIYYTSGTTGDPKGVVLSHRNICHHALMASAALGLNDRDVFAHIAPMFHLADAWAVYAITGVGGRHRFAPRFDASAVLRLLRHETTLTNLVPTMLSDLVHHPESAAEYPTLRRVLSGGAPIAPALVQGLADTFGCPYIQTYGLTETSPFLTMSTLPARCEELADSERRARRCKTGRPLMGVQVRVLRDDGNCAARDGKEVGEIVARGDSVTPGYWRNPTATAAAFRDGWFHTGDLATWDAEGFLNIVDRKKDIVLSGGETVYSTEVEHLLASHPAVREVAVIGLPHPRWGEAVVAAVVLRDGQQTSEDALRQHARGTLGSHQIPQRILFLKELPRTGTGKLAKRLLREQHAELFGSPQ